MRKALICFLMAGLFIFSLNSPVHAYNAWDKLIRGTINFLVSPLEFFQGIGDAVNEHKDIAVAVPVGIGRGAWNTIKRAGVGIYEIISFPIPFPADYRPVLEEPKFFRKSKE